jgi:hypothetical protein
MSSEALHVSRDKLSRNPRETPCAINSLMEALAGHAGPHGDLSKTGSIVGRQEGSSKAHGL